MIPPGAALPKSAAAGPLMTSTRSTLAKDEEDQRLVWARIPLRRLPELRFPVVRNPRILKIIISGVLAHSTDVLYHIIHSGGTLVEDYLLGYIIDCLRNITDSGAVLVPEKEEVFL